MNTVLAFHKEVQGDEWMSLRNVRFPDIPKGEPYRGDVALRNLSLEAKY